MRAEDKRKIKSELFQKRRGRCSYCDARMSYEEATLDHVTPRSQGGGNTRDNLRLSCKTCNGLKANMTPWEWLLAQGQRAD